MSTPLDLTRFIRSGDTVMWGQSHAEPLELIGRLLEQRHEIGRVRLFLGIGLGAGLTPEHADTFDYLSYCGTGSNRALSEAGVLDILPVHYSRLAALVETGDLRVDVLLLQVSPPDSQGRHSLGMAREYLVGAVGTARVIIGEVHEGVPWTFGGPYLRERDFTALISSAAALAESRPKRTGDVEAAIGRNVAAFVDDGATLQLGIGNIPDAVLASLVDRADLGVHTGAIGDGVVALCEAGVVTNARKSVDPGVTIGGALMGGSRLRAFAHNNPALELRATSYTHSPDVLGRVGRLVAINSAIEVDLTGQVNSEVAGGRYIGAVGGIVDFLRAAGATAGGVPVIALPAVGGGRTRIVPALSGPVTVARSEPCVIVTEYGAADLRGLTLSQRSKALIDIAHPMHREALERASWERDDSR